MPDSNDPRVRVDVKKNSMARVLSRSRACGSPNARLRFRSHATSSTVSTSSLEKSRSPIKSLPLKLVCIVGLLVFWSLVFDELRDGPVINIYESSYPTLSPVNSQTSRLVDFKGLYGDLSRFEV